ncbi:MAG TPA: hypothetical protein VGP92_05770 [Acidimicrobiia bacterium]|jgi:hypothetical protein|nr:hypothetical protein [Acidimicrobiia bacterium]
MAPVLQCPDCGEKHPLSRVPDAGAFACDGCGRVLKVPEAVGQRRAAAAAAAAAPPPVPTPAVRPTPVASAVANPNAAAPESATRAVPAVDEQALGALSGRTGRRPTARLAPVPRWMRLLLWFVAVPLSFMFVFLTARAVGMFTTNQLSDVFLANNTGRFVPVARLLPFVALMTAVLVHGGVYLVARLRGRRGKAAPAEFSVSGNRSRTR